LADQAFWNSRQAQGIQPILRTWSAPSTWSLTRKKLDEQQRAFLVKVAKDLETQARFESAVAALKLHYGIAACTMSLEIQSQAESYLNEQIAVEKEPIQHCSKERLWNLKIKGWNWKPNAHDSKKSYPRSWALIWLATTMPAWFAFHPQSFMRGAIMSNGPSISELNCESFRLPMTTWKRSTKRQSIRWVHYSHFPVAC
jgi:hypothetical protein